MGKLGTLDFKDNEIIANYVEDPTHVRRLYGQDAVLKHLKSDLRIIVETKDIQEQQRGKYNFIEGKAVLINDLHGFNGKIEVACKIACGKLYLLKSLIQGETINILDHLELLLPTFECIGLFTFQNGIQNSPTDFHSMGQKILEKLPESPLCIGFYNATYGVGYGIINDLARLPDEWHLNPFSVMIMRQMLIAFVKILSSIKSRKIWWTHIAHSEAGLIANEVLTTKNYCLFQQNSGLDDFLKNHVITLTYGGVAPIPDVVHLAINNYSEDDITMFYAKHYLDKTFRPATNEDKALREMAKKMYSFRHFPKSQKSEDEIYNDLKAGTESFFFTEYPHRSTKNGCTVTIIKSDVPKREQPLIEKDHAFDGKTYQNALMKNIDDLREAYKIHDCR
ncbi:MAG: hypothetical protein H0V82_13110 [Candidatus Protochlamydia sp.]|nr:hypothetical protein [Candidatus Protochlamydia sp.]